MRRLRDTDGTKKHKRAAKDHLGKLTIGGAPIHQELHTEMKTRFDKLKSCERAADDADDDAVEAGARCDQAEIHIEDIIRDIDADLSKLDRAEPTRHARKTVFSEGYGKEIDPEGDAQLANLPLLRQRIESVGPHPVVTEALTRFDAGVTLFKSTLKGADDADDLVDALFQEEQDARKAIREQMEVAYGKLLGYYKGNPRKAEEFFLREGSRRKPK